MKSSQVKEIYKSIEHIFKYFIYNDEQRESSRIFIDKDYLKFKSGENVIEQDLSALKKIIKKISDYRIDGNVLYTKNKLLISCEFDNYKLAVYDEKGSSNFAGFTHRSISASNLPNNLGNGRIRIGIKKAPLEYVIYHLWQHFFNEKGLPQNCFDYGRSREKINKALSSNGQIGILDVIETFNFYTLMVKSKNESSKEYLLNVAYNYVYRCEYSYNLTIKLIRSYDNYFLGLKTINRGGQDFDKDLLLIPSELIILYQRASNTTSPEAQFLFFYHIFEYFFNKTIEVIVDEITEYKKLQKYEGINLNSLPEIERFKLTLKRFIDNKYLNNIPSLIDSEEVSLTQYFKSNSPSFCNNNVFINFESNDYNLKINQIATRVYGIRNSIVHQKDGHKSRFKTLENENELIFDNILLRILSEAVLKGAKRKNSM